MIPFTFTVRIDPLKINWTNGFESNLCVSWVHLSHNFCSLVCHSWNNEKHVIHVHRPVYFFFLSAFFSVGWFCLKWNFTFRSFYSLRTLFILRCALRQFSNKLQWCTTTHRTQVEKSWKKSKRKKETKSKSIPDMKRNEREKS